jgi:Bifunctional DNA primase/polymerase, N-terminal
MYWAAGWRSILPIPAGRKKSPPAGYTGHDATAPSYADISQWAEHRPGDNLCLAMPAGVIGVDVDGYDPKTGASTLAEAETRWGALPGTVRSTSRPDDPISGIYLYRVPPDTTLAGQILFPELGLGDVELIQPHHRYAMAWPSTHPSGRPYLWLAAFTLNPTPVDIPEPGALPELPARWVNGLQITPANLLDVANVDVEACLTLGEPSARVGARLAQAITALGAGGSRHDAMVENVLALLRFGKQNEPGIAAALMSYRAVFVAVVTGDGSRSAEDARAEYHRALTNAGAARLLGTPDVAGWFGNLGTLAVDLGAVRGEPGPADAPQQPESLASLTTLEPAEPGALGLETLEADFWTARAAHRLIFAAALSRMASPWAALACAVARILAVIPPSYSLPAVIGGPGSLNWFAVIAAKSGGGKGAAMSVARDVLWETGGRVNVRPIGSGEGMVEAYRRNGHGKNGDALPPVTSVLFTADEIDSVAAQSHRQGSTTMPILRQGFSGETLGYCYRGRADDVVPANTYRLTAVIAVQPERAGLFLDDAGGGTPQRFMWFPAGDKRIIAPAPLWPVDRFGAPARVPGIGADDLARDAGEIVVEPAVLAEIAGNRARGMNGNHDALDSHAMFAREKFAFALACMDGGRTEVTAEDWRLAGIAAAVSAKTREWVAAGYRTGKDKDARETGRLRAVTYDAQHIGERDLSDERIKRIVARIVRKLGKGPATVREISQSLGREYVWREAALAAAIDAGLIMLIDGRYHLCPQT